MLFAQTTYGNNNLNYIDATFRRRLQFPKQNESIYESRAVAPPACLGHAKPIVA
jgi:hypothetical protein